MAFIEEMASTHNCDASQVRAGVDILEKGAFDRGLPEECKIISNSMQHKTQDVLQRENDNGFAGEPDRSPPAILLIDDEESFRCVLKQVLVNAGFEVFEASNGAEGIRHFYEHPADMIITDIIMPEKEGIETIIELKSKCPEVKLIAMSGGGGMVRKSILIWQKNSVPKPLISHLHCKNY